MKNSKLDSVFRKSLEQSFRPRSKLKLWEWMEENIELDSVTTATPGSFSFDSCPWLKEVCNSIENPDVETVVGLKCTQSNLTQLACNVMLWWVVIFGLPITFFTATQTLYKGFVNEKLKPTLELCKAIQEYRSEKDDDESQQTITFPGRSILRMGTGGSVASLAGSPAALVIIDEASKWRNSKVEAKSYALALQRSRTFKFQRKHIIISTPAEQATCTVYAEYLKGDMRVLKFKSPYSGLYFEIDEHCLQKPSEYQNENGDYDWQKIEENTWVADPTTRTYKENGEIDFVGQPITKYQREELFSTWKWVPTNLNPKDRKRHSYHISAFYSSHVSWGELLVMYIQAQDDIEERKTLQTQYFGKPWVQRATSANVNYINKIIENAKKSGIDYSKGELPFEPVFLFGAADSQKESYPWVIEALCSDGKSYVIDYGVAADLDSLKIVGDRTYSVRTNPKGTRYEIDRFFIDEGGFIPTTVRDFSITSGFKFICVKGTSRFNKEGNSEEKESLDGSKMSYVSHRSPKKDFPLYRIKDSEYKFRLIDEYFMQGKTKLFFPYDVSEEFKRQITNESYDEVGKQNGMPLYEWRTHGPNHYLDCIKYCEAARDLYEPFLQSLVTDKPTFDTPSVS